MTGLIRRYSQTATVLGLLCALALVLTGFSGSPQTPPGTFSGPTKVAASAADGTITVTWNPGNAAASQVIVVVNVLDDTDYCLEVDFTGTANSYQCAERTEGETYVALVIALDGEGGYELGMTTQRVPVTFTGLVGDPDLVVSTPTVDGGDPTIGATFTLQTTVTNRGRESSGASTLRYYRSTEPVISSADTAVGSEPVSGLAAAGASDLSMDLTAPREPGTYYYRACVDRASGESNTTNNCSGVLAVTVVAPDLAVGVPTVDGDNPLLGTTFTMAATVTNQGSGASAATTLRYYSSTDATISTSDTELDTDSVGTLEAYGTSDQSIDLDAPTNDGTYYYGACVDAVSDESDTANNCSGALVMTLGAPDLVVSTPSVSADNPTAGASFTLSATVRNQGSSGAGAATTLRYYRSTDDTITTSDTELGTDSVSALAAFGASEQSIDLTAPSQTGTYYYGACIDTVTGESSTTNNCSDALAVNVVAPDLLVSTLTLEGDDPAVGASFTLQARVLNQGGAESGSTTLRFYRSADATITTSDTEAVTVSVSSVAAAGVSTQSIQLTAPSDAGDYHYGACVDAVSGESDTANNCSSALSVTVEAPDLTVSTPAVDGGSPTVGASFTLSATVRNRGGAESSATTLRFYRSDDTTIATSDTELGTDSVGILAAFGTSGQSIDLTAQSTAGTYYYGVCVDAVTGESDTTNNCSGVLFVTVVAPDLVVNTPTVDGDDPTLGATFTMAATVKNQGGGESAATTLRYYSSTDATITTSDTSLGTDSVGSLAAAGASDQSIELTAPSDAGTYYYGACVDGVSDESDTANNCSSALALTIGAPDLVVSTPTVASASQTVGASFTLNATVRNRGSAESAAATLRYYRSTDVTITTSDTELGTDSVGALAAFGNSDQSIDLTAPSDPGTYYYGACADTVTGESSTTNNCSDGLAVTVVAPNLLVSTPTLKGGNPAVGASFTLEARVLNQGGAESAATTVRFYRSADTTITTSDMEVGTGSVSGVAASGVSTQSIDLTAPSDTGAYYYGACVDWVSGESDTTNNCSSALTVTVVAEASTAPDLVVGTPSISDSSLGSGFLLTLYATVRNNGGGAAPATTLRSYQSTDATITTSDTEVATVTVLNLAASGSSDESINMVSPPTPGVYYYGACVDAVVGESDTTNNCSTSVQVTILADMRPDLVVVSPSVSDSNPAAGATFTLSVTVRNDGDSSGGNTALNYYRSAGSTITTADTFLRQDTVAWLAASGSSDHSIELTAPSTDGIYYYGACLPFAASIESNTTNNCSAAVSVRVGGQPPLARVEVTPDEAELTALSATATLAAKVFDDQGDETAGATVTWSSGDTEVATVSTAGVVTAVANGSATITATSSAGLTGTAAVTVRQRVASVEIDPGTVEFTSVGDYATLTGRILDANGHTFSGSHSRGWSSADETVATADYQISSEGPKARVKAIGQGTTTVTLSANGGGGSASGTATVTVTVSGSRVEVSPRKLTFTALGDSATATVRILDENGDEDTDATYGWIGVSSPCCIPDIDLDDPRVMSIKRVDGGLEITAQGPGRGSITISSEGATSAILLVTVHKEPKFLTVSPSSKSLAAGETATLSATITDANGHDIALASGNQGGLVVYWETSDSAVATVVGADGANAETGATATVTAVAAGTATITGRWGGRRVTGTATVTVTDSN